MAHMGDRRGAYRVLVGKPEEKRLLGRPKRRWEYNVNIDQQEWDGDMDWIKVTQDRDRWRTVVNAVINLQVLPNAGIFLTS